MTNKHGNSVGKQRRKVGDCCSGNISARGAQGTNSNIEIKQPLIHANRRVSGEVKGIDRNPVLTSLLFLRMLRRAN